MARGSLQERSPGKWFLRCYAGIVNGKQKYITKTVRGTRRQAEAQLAKLVLEVENRQHTTLNRRQRLNDCIDAWLRKRRIDGNISPHTIATQEGIINRYIRPRIGWQKVTTINPDDIEDYYLDLLESNLSPATIAGVRAILNSVFGDLRGLPNNPVKSAKAPKIQRRTVHPMTNAELVAIMEASKEGILDLPIKVLLCTGLRRGEMLGLQWIDYKSNGLEVRHNLQMINNELVVTKPKSDAGNRFVALPDSLLQELEQHRQEQRKKWVSIGIRPSPGFIFPNAKGGPQSPDSFGHMMSELGKKANIKNFGCHRLRHQHVSQLIEAGISLAIIKERLGHASIKTTIDIYGHMLPDSQTAAADAAQKWINKLQSEIKP